MSDGPDDNGRERPTGSEADSPVTGLLGTLAARVTGPMAGLLGQAFEVDIDLLHAAGKGASEASDHLRALLRREAAALSGAAEAHRGWLFATGLVQAADAAETHLSGLRSGMEELGGGLTGSADRYREVEGFGEDLLDAIRERLHGTR